MAVTGARPSGAAAGDGKVLGIADRVCGEGDEPGITRPSARRRGARHGLEGGQLGERGAITSAMNRGPSTNRGWQDPWHGTNSS